MKLRTYLFRGLIATSAVFMSAACGGSNSKTDGMGGASSQDAAIDELRSEIEELKKKLEEGDGDRDELLKQLDEAEERLKQLETCEVTGDCPGLGDTKEKLRGLTDAYCEWVFGCCDEDQTRAGISAAFGSVDACKSTYGSMIARGEASFDFRLDGPLSSIQYDLRSLLETASSQALLIEQGRVAINDEALEACTSAISGLSCNDAYEQPACGYEWPLSVCEGMWDGLQTEGQGCYTSLECDDGYVCGGEYGYGYGFGTESVCVPEPVADDPCVDDSDCYRPDRELYCDEDAGTCKQRPGEGETCVFEDPSFTYGGTSLRVPCQGDLECSWDTKTCVNECEQDANCRAYWSSDDPRNNRDCAPELVCNRTALDDSALSSSYGVCDAPGVKDEERMYAHECETLTSYLDESVLRCDGKGGEDCESAGECASGMCDDSGKCVTYCGGSFADACEADEYCFEGGCLSQVPLGGKCFLDASCAEGICANDGVCRDPVESGGDCSVTEGGDDRLCPDGEYCMSVGLDTYECAAFAAEGESCAEVPCGDDLSCIEGTCEPDYFRDDGVACDDWYHCASERCSADTGVCVSGQKGEGEACASDPVVEGSQNYDIAYDECAKGLYCQRSEPNSDDFSGVCTKQGAVGTLCNESVDPDVRQCAGNTRCEYNYTIGEDVCPAVYDDDTDADSCMIYGIPYEWAPDANDEDGKTIIVGPIGPVLPL